MHGPHVAGTSRACDDAGMARHRTKEERARIVAAWRASGHGLFRFARERGLSPNTLKRWAEASVAEPAEPSFVRLEVASRTAPTIAVEVGGARVVVEPGFDRALLRAVVEALS